MISPPKLPSYQRGREHVVSLEQRQLELLDLFQIHVSNDSFDILIGIDLF